MIRVPSSQVDIADFNGSFLSKVRDLVGANPIILVGTKVDLLPADTDLEAVADWVWDATVRKKLKPISVHLVSLFALL
jgi:nitric-oxide synthase